MSFALNFAYKNSSITVTLYFKAFKNYDETRRKALALMEPSSLQEVSLDITKTDLLEFEDDHGSVCSMHMYDISSVIGIDCEKNAACQAEQQVMMQKEMAKAAEKARNDPAMKLLKPQMVMPSNGNA